MNPTTAHDEGTGLGGFARDTRGAVAVIGTFMAAFLVGILWYAIGIGDAAIYRGRMQDGADAVAFASAVYHARGMNIIVMLNLIMAAIMAVLMALKAAQMLISVTSFIVCLLPPPPGALCPPAKAAKTSLDNFIKTAEPKIKKILKALSKAQRAVAVGTPIAAEVKAVVTAQNYAPPVKSPLGGAMLSIALVPSGERLGLPVAEDGYRVLCDRGSEALRDLMLVPVKGLGLKTKWVNALVTPLTDTFPIFFCSGAGKNKLKDLVDREAKDICKEKKKAHEQEQEGKDPADVVPWDAAMQSQCIGDTEAEMSSKGVDGKTEVPDTFGNIDEMTPKTVWQSAKNGNLYFQVYGAVWGGLDAAREKDGKRIRALPAWNRKSEGGGSQDDDLGELLTKFAVAQSEYYFDTDQDWSSVSEKAMWELRWMARLRRIHAPTPVVFAELQGYVGEELTSMIQSAINKKSPLVEKFVKRLSSKLDKTVDELDAIPDAAAQDLIDDYVIH